MDEKIRAARPGEMSETRSESEAASYASNPSSKLVAMLADDLERFHVQLELHLVSGWRCRVRLKAAIIDLHVVDVLVAALLERRGNPRTFLLSGRTVFRGSRRAACAIKKTRREFGQVLVSSLYRGTASDGLQAESAFSSSGCRRLPDRKGSKDFSKAKSSSSLCALLFKGFCELS
jgi:hypothetical protein